MSTLHPHSLHNMIAQDSAAIGELKSLLLRERELLEQRDHSELPAIIERKDQLLETLGLNARQRASLLKAAGFKASPEQWEIFLGQNAATRDLLDSWRSLMAEFAQCKSLNEINGKMIGREHFIAENARRTPSGIAVGSSKRRNRTASFGRTHPPVNRPLRPLSPRRSPTARPTARPCARRSSTSSLRPPGSCSPTSSSSTPTRPRCRPSSTRSRASHSCS